MIAYTHASQPWFVLSRPAVVPLAFGECHGEAMESFLLTMSKLAGRQNQSASHVLVVALSLPNLHFESSMHVAGSGGKPNFRDCALPNIACIMLSLDFYYLHNLT